MKHNEIFYENAGEKKVNEYVTRIKNGESKEDIIRGLHSSFVSAIENKLKDKSDDIKDTLRTKDDIFDIPPQYKNLNSEVLEDVWVIPEYLDEDKTREEKDKKRKVLEILKKKENLVNVGNRNREDQNKINEIEKELGIEKNNSLFNLTQNELAQYIIDNKIKLRQDQIYELLTCRKEFRDFYLKENREEWSKRFEVNKDYLNQITNLENDKSMDSSSNPGWFGVNIGDSRNKEKDGRRKGYLTISIDDIDKISDSVENIMKEMVNILKNSGYNGAIKIPHSFNGLKLRFDNIVMHGATTLDVELGLKVIGDFLKNKNIKIEQIERGIDKEEDGKKKSHTEILAEEVFEKLNR